MGQLFLQVVQTLLAAQAAQGAIVGVVRDAETSVPVAGAVVMITDLDRAATTDADGRYVLHDVAPGSHPIAVRCVGYAPRTLSALVPQQGALEIDLSLRTEPVPLPAVVVRAPVVVRGAEGAVSTEYPDREISNAAMRNNPMLEEPDPLAALGGGEVVLQPESPGGIHLRGGASDQTAYLLDGMPVFSPYHAAGISSAWNPDAISRLTLSSSASSQDFPHALSGAVEAATLTPGERARVQGSTSSTQARVTVDGPAGRTGAGYLVSARSGLHDVIAPRREVSYLKGGTSDWLAKLELPALGGRARLLGYGDDNEIRAAAAPEEDPSGLARHRNMFAWHGRSLGAEWRRTVAGIGMRAMGWSASGDAGSNWMTLAGPIAMDGTRHDLGLCVSVERLTVHPTRLELRVEQSRTRYRIESDSAAGPLWSLNGLSPVATVLVRQAGTLGPRVGFDLGSSIATARHGLYWGPRATLRWKLSQRFTLSGSLARTHQFAQSIRNPESAAGDIFPVDVYVGAGSGGVPVAEGDLGVLAAQFAPRSRTHLGVQAYQTASRGLLLVAPRDGEPFSTGAFVIGSALIRGVAADAAVRSSRWGLVASYGWQHVRYQYGDSSYVPGHGAAHHVEGGVIVLPTSSSSVRLGATAILGGRTTVVPNGLEWVSYSLLNQGAEFGGSPHYGGEPLGGARLPGYVRVDLGLRKHWRLDVGGRDASLDLFGTATNLLGRRNIATYARNPATGEIMAVQLRSPGILVAGLDWRF